MDELKSLILEKGEIRSGNILKVDNFLNHQLDVAFLHKIGQEFYNIFKNDNITKIVTVEVSGIAIAAMAALFFKVPVVFAKKTESFNLDNDVYSSKVFSYTKNKEYNIRISKKYLDENDKILIIDDFLAQGNAVKGLIDIVKESGAYVSGIGIVIEKGFQSGGKFLRDEGYKLKSLAIVDEMNDDGIVFR